MSVRKLRLEITEHAIADIRSIEQYTFQHWGPARAVAYDQTIDRVLETLRTQPGLGTRRDDLGPGLRSHPVQSHVIFYLVEGDTLTIQRILHGRMNAMRADFR